MKIDSKDRKVKDLFTKKQYNIPDYQRPYSWKKNEEVLVFWEDFLESLDGNESFFLGPMVFRGDNGVDSNYLDVIDGQQRLITLSIIISVLVYVFDKLKENNLSDRLKDFLIFKDLENKEKVVIDTEAPYPFYQEAILHGYRNTKPDEFNEGEVLINEARVFFELNIEDKLNNFRTKKEKLAFLKEVRDKILDIDVVIIVSKNEEDVFTIFETINTRGKDLSSLDLLKNYIFKTHTFKPGILEPKTKWLSIQNSLRKGSDKFFNRFWSSYVKKVSEKKLFRDFSFYMKKEKNPIFNDTQSLLLSLELSSIVYKKILSPRIDDWKIDNNISVYYTLKHLVGHFNVKVIIPFLLSLIEEFEKGKIKRAIFLKTLLALENFHFIFSHIVSSRASGLDAKYSSFAIRLRKEKNKEVVLKELVIYLNNKIPSLIEYKESFDKLNFEENKDTIKYILLRLEREKSLTQLVDLEDNTIEHLHPKSIELQNKHSIGNLFLLEKTLNDEKKDILPFGLIQKKLVIDYLKNNTKYLSTKKEFEIVSKNKKWDGSDIEKRKGVLAKETYTLFSKIKNI